MFRRARRTAHPCQRETTGYEPFDLDHAVLLPPPSKGIGWMVKGCKPQTILQGGGGGKESGGGERPAHRARPARSSPRQRAYPRSRLDYTPQYSLARARSRARNLCSCSLSLLSLSPLSLSLSRIPTPDRDSVRTLSRASARKARGAEKLVCYRRTTSASTAPRTSRRMCCPHCAGYCAPCRPLWRVFSEWIRSSPPARGASLKPRTPFFRL